MQTHLDDATRSLAAISEDLKVLAGQLDHRHRQQRKTQFLLDIRGYLIMNRPLGDYVEFGLYRGEMMFSAHYILDRTGVIERYVGFDNFSGEPDMTEAEKASLPFIKPGDYCADESETRAFLEGVIGPRLHLVKGDFRSAAARVGEPSHPVSVGVIDCNLPSSIASALGAILPKFVPGGLLFLDDYFLNIVDNRLWQEDALERAAADAGRTLRPFNTYPPCARAFIVL